MLKAQATSKSEVILKALKNTFPLAMSGFPFGIVMGVTAFKYSLTVNEYLYMNLPLNAGASQLAFVELFKNNINDLVILISCILINARMLLYSLSLHDDFRDLGTFKKLILSFFVIDQSYAAYEAAREELKTLNDKYTYYLTSGLLIVTSWQSGCMVGYFKGDILPYKEHLDFLVALAFIGIFGPKLKSKINLIVFLFAVTASIVLYQLPFNLGLLVSTIVSMIFAVAVKKKWEFK